MTPTLWRFINSLTWFLKVLKAHQQPSSKWPLKVFKGNLRPSACYLECNCIHIHFQQQHSSYPPSIGPTASYNMYDWQSPVSTNKDSLSTKNKNQNLVQYCFYHPKLNLPFFLPFLDIILILRYFQRLPKWSSSTVMSCLLTCYINQYNNLTI